MCWTCNATVPSIGQLLPYKFTSLDLKQPFPSISNILIIFFLFSFFKKFMPKWNNQPRFTWLTCILLEFVIYIMFFWKYKITPFVQSSRFPFLYFVFN